ncbi:endonuclease/exonuclease/phosphatase family protein [Nonomuraea sp. NPDC049421]|uniref:endonuclease/exonuclease/phosphatase family protein n=1 Tax=Nonomuraea sp. NPDC049421 TaxID=3155275 RepID=UPI00343FEE49
MTLPVHVRVGTYNLHGMRAGLAALAPVVVALRADVLCVQEVPRFVRWRARRGALAASAGLAVATHGRVGGVAVLTGPRMRVLHAEHHALRPFRGLERRALALAVVEPVGDGGRLVVGSFHLDLDEAARAYHVEEIIALMEDAAARHDASIVLGGDLNEQDHQPAWRHMAARLADCHAEAPAGGGPTFRSPRPRRRIDAVFAAREIAVVSCGVPLTGTDQAGASDHFPVVAELRVGH